MLDRYIHDIVLSFLVGCIACLSMAYVNNADGRVFTVDLKGTSSPQGLREAERACAVQNARLASGAELRRAVLECSFSTCTRGWLSDGAVGTTECRNAGSSLTAMEVRTENTTDQTANLNAFCIKDTDVPCGDPPSFPNTRLQGAAGFELGDELLYACVPGYRMPSGNSAFSLLCDSCGEWYGLVQMCLRDQSELHVDYEDRFPEGYGALDHHSHPAEGPAERDEDHHSGPAEVPADGEEHPHVPEAGFPAGHDTHNPRYPAIFQATRGGPQRRDQQGEEAVGDEGLLLHAMEGVPVAIGEDVQGDVPLEPAQEPVVLAGPDSGAASQATTAPVSQLSQKHMFWFPSEAFHGEGYPAPNEPVTQITTAQDDQSDESEEAHPDADAGDKLGGHRVKDKEQQGFYDRDRDHHDDQEESRQRDDHDDSRHSDHDDHDDHDDHIHGADQDVHGNSRQEEYQEEDPLDQHVKNYNPGQRDNADRYGRYDDDVDPRDHYDMGEHDDDVTRHHVHHGGGREDADGDRGGDDDDDVEQDSYDEVHGGDDHEEREDHREHEHHPEGSEEDLDGETAEHDEDHGDRDADRDRDDDRDRADDDDNVETNDSDEIDEHDDRDVREDQDEYREEHDNGDDVDRHPQVTFPMATDEPTSQEEAERKPTPTTDKSWLDGYPIGPEEAERGGSTEEEQEEQEEASQEQPLVVLGGVAPIDESNEADRLPERPSDTPDSEEDRAGDAWPGRFRPREPTPSPGGRGSQDSVSHPDAPDQDRTKDPDLTRGQEEDPGLTKVAEGTEGKVSLAGEGGESVPVEGEMGEAVCTGEDCPPPPPPPSSSSRGPIVAAVIAAICAVAVAAVMGAWLYRRRQQKNSMYQLNGKGHGQCTAEQQMEMQQKV